MTDGPTNDQDKSCPPRASVPASSSGTAIPRSDARSGNATAAASPGRGEFPGRGELLERLIAVVRPEFRVEVFLPRPDDPIFYPGCCVLRSCTTAVHQLGTGLCEIHYTWWREAGRPDVQDWAPEAEQRLQAELFIPDCAVDGCRRAPRRNQLCARHDDQWGHAGRPTLTRWLTTVWWTTTVEGERDCRWPGCIHWSDGPSNPFCAIHGRRWAYAGRPDLDTWVADIPTRYDPRVDLRELPPPLRLEVQFGIQARHDELTKVTRIPKLITAVNIIRQAGVRSLLDWHDEQWRDYTRRPNAGGSAYQSFILDTCYHLRQLLIDDPWIHEYPRDVWDLKAPGLYRGDRRHIDFSRVGPPWLKELVKRWARWRLVRGMAPGTVCNGVRALALLGEHLRRRAGSDAGPEEVTRELLETWLAALASILPDPHSRKHAIGGVSTFLRDVERHQWAAAIPRNARIYEDDYPKTKPPQDRWLPEHLMSQLEDPANLARFRTDDGRLLLMILIECGLRLGDARRLPLDCVTHDRDGAPYLAWVNYKINERVSFFPIRTELAELIAAQQRRQHERFPHGARYLFPGQQANLSGQKPANHHTWRQHLNQWLEEIELVDEHGRRVHVTPHQFRHTLATRLLNNDVPQHVVQDLLDHMSPDMTARYAKLLDKTRRAHWEKAMKVNAEGEPVTIAPEHPLADARWTKLSLVRAKVTLPNGYCGAPVQTDCEFANPCLDCRFFITTPEFLPLHIRQRDETRKLVVDAQQAGLARVAEKNQRTAAKLDKLIDVLEQTPAEDIVIGGRREDHAAG